MIMKEVIQQIQRPSKEEQLMALASYDALASTIEQLRSENPEIEIEETDEKIKIPLKALKFLATILCALSEGRPVSIVAGATEMTTQSAAEMLGCSRPFLIRILEEGKIPFTKVGRHRRIKVEDVMVYKKQMKADQKALLIEIMKGDEASGLYDS
jgi:excisionase family DNA binding protein